MLVWFGVAGAVKLQAIFLAPFALGVMIRHRTPFYYSAVPLIAYTLIALPAALGGWPVIGLATIYFHQAGWGPTFIGNAANPWILGLYAPELAQRLFIVGTFAAAAASAWMIYAVGTARIALLRAAVLSALIIPYLLPKMHERYYFAADVLAFLFACALRSRESVAIALLVTGASLAAILGNAREEWAITMAGAVLATAAVLLLIKDRADERGVDLERQPA
jgi:Gpi18-like mannosyltransferase